MQPVCPRAGPCESIRLPPFDRNDRAVGSVRLGHLRGWPSAMVANKWAVAGKKVYHSRSRWQPSLASIGEGLATKWELLRDNFRVDNSGRGSLFNSVR